MKTKAIKMLAMATLATACVGAVTLTWNVAGADSEFVMGTGASVRMSTTADESAIRFYAKVSDTTKDYRMLIVPTAIFEYHDIAATENVVSELKTIYTDDYATKFNDFEVEPFYAEIDGYQGNVVMGAMKKVNADYYAEEYTAIAYYMDGTNYVCASFENGANILTNARTVSFVGSVALNNEDYKVTGDETKTNEQKGALEAFVKGALGGDALVLDQTDGGIMKISDEVTLTGNTTGLAVKYTSSNEDVATVDNAGKVTFVGEGETTVTAKIGNSFSDTVAYTAYDADEWANRVVAVNYTPNSTDINNYLTGSLTTSVEEFGANVVAPTDTSYSTYIHYTVKGKNSLGNLSANFLNFSNFTETKNTRVTCPMPASLYEEYKTLDWANAYVSFWMYNGTTVEAKVRGTQKSAGVNYSSGTSEGPGNENDFFEMLNAGEWTKVTAKLSDICEITNESFLSNNYNLKFWLSFTDSNYKNVEGTWDFYLTGFEIYTVSAEEQADLANTAMNNALLNSYTPDSSKINNYLTGSLTTSVEEFGANVVAPTDTSYSTYIHYTVKGKNSQGNFRANFLNFSNFTETRNTRVTCPMPAPLYEEYKTLDWANAYVSFWMYNGTTVEAKVRGTQKSAGVNYSSGTSESLGNENDFFEMLNAGEWTKVTAKLSDICEITNESFLSNNYNLKFWLSFTDSNYKTVEGTWDFYLTGFEIYTVSAEEQADLANTAMNNALLSNYTADSSKINKYYPTKLTASVEEFDTNFAAPTGTSYSTYVNYVATGTNSSGGLFVNFINFSNITDTTTLNTRVKLPMSDSLYNQCASLDWENAFISFWIYNGAAADIELYGTQPFEGVNYGGTASEACSRTAIQSLNAGEWTKVTVKLSDICEVTNEGFAAKNYNLKLWLSGTNTAFVGNSSNFYLTGFEFVSGTAQA